MVWVRASDGARSEGAGVEPETRVRFAEQALRQLPPRVAGFHGRGVELATVVALLRPDVGANAVLVSAVAGLAGVGKTALAVHAAHVAVEAGWFPGGVLFLDLHGYDDTPVEAHQALDSLLRALDVPGGQIPSDTEARVGLYRSVLASRPAPVLLVADNASSAAQVRPLLPGDDRHRVLITSRHTLAQLGARLLDLAVLGHDESVVLLGAALRTADPDDPRVGTDPPAAEEVARRCGHLPLALQIAAALLVGDPDLTFAELAAELAHADRRLTHLDDGERAVRAAFDLSYQRFTPEQARLFRLLALNPGPDIATRTAAVLAVESHQRVRRVLGELAGAHMLERSPVRGRWRMHDLIRDYAHGLARDPADDRAATTGRLLDYYLHTALAANQHITHRRGTTRPADERVPHTVVTANVVTFADRAEALAWMEVERPNLEACVSLAATSAAAAVAIAHAAADFLYEAAYWQQAMALHAIAVTIAGSPLDKANALNDLGVAHRVFGNYAAATTSLEQALDLYRELDDRAGQASALNNIGILRYLAGDYPAATDSHTRALDLYRAVGDRLGQANALNDLGVVQRMTDEYAAAAGTLNQALDLFHELDDRLGQANALKDIGAVHFLVDEYPVATDYLVRALDLFAGLDNRLGQASALIFLADVYRLTGDYEAAMASQVRALDLYQVLNSRLGEANARYGLGILQRLSGEYAAAGDSQSRALELYIVLDSAVGQINAIEELGVLQRESGNYAEAETLLVEALGRYRDLDDRGGEVEALNDYAVLVAVTGDPARARTLHLQAGEIAREITSSKDEADSLAGIAATYRVDGDWERAREFFEQALELYRSIGCAAHVALVERAVVELP